MISANSRPSASLLPFSRRALIGSGLAAAALTPLGSARLTAAVTGAAAAPARGAWQDDDTDPRTWRTWVLDSADELRPAAPPDPTPAEIDEVLGFQADRSDEVI